MHDPKIPYNQLPLLPGDFEYDKKSFLKLAIKASEELSKLNGLVKLIPNHKILIAPLLMKESVESSAIENINTTTLKVLQSEALPESAVTWPEKEVLHYHRAILAGYERLQQEWGIGYNAIISTQSLIEPSKPWVRKIPGTVIANGYGEVLYTPPVGEDVIVWLLSNLEKWMNESDDDIDPLIKMPVIHYQFESIHPFYDGNGRTGRILNVLYLIMSGKLDYPVLFLSEYINKHRKEYYRLFTKTRDTGDYSDFIIYMLEWVILQAKSTSEKIIAIHALMQEIEEKMSKLNLDYHKIAKILFSKPFLTVSEFSDLMGYTRQTATKYIQLLEENNLVSSMKIGKNKLLYISAFINLLQ
jgi:Fic family protein